MHTISEKSDAQMAESVDALVSNTSRFTPVPVRPRLWVLKERNESFSLFFVCIEWRESTTCCTSCMLCWVLASKLATPNKPHTGYASSRHSILTHLRGAHLNMRLREHDNIYCSTLRSALYGVRASASHFDPALGTRERNESFSLFCLYIVFVATTLLFAYQPNTLQLCCSSPHLNLRSALACCGPSTHWNIFGFKMMVKDEITSNLVTFGHHFENGGPQKTAKRG